MASDQNLLQLGLHLEANRHAHLHLTNSEPSITDSNGGESSGYDAIDTKFGFSTILGTPAMCTDS